MLNSYLFNLRIRQFTPVIFELTSVYLIILLICLEYGVKSFVSKLFILFNTYSKYCSTLILLILQVWTIENNLDVYFAPAYDPDVWNTFTIHIFLVRYNISPLKNPDTYYCIEINSSYRWCRGSDSNRHIIADNRFWVYRVYQFHHCGSTIILAYL